MSRTDTLSVYSAAAGSHDADNGRAASGQRCRLCGCALILLLAAVLFAINVPRIFTYDFWSDECFSVLLSHMSFRDMLSATAVDVHPPFFYAVVMLFYRLFGDQAWAYGLAALIPFGASLLLCATYLRRKFGCEAAALTMLCWTFMYNAVTYNSELRMYSWTSFFVFSCFCLLYACLEGHSWLSHILLGLTAAMASYCHYYGFLSAGLLLLGLLVHALRERVNLKKCLVTCLCAFLAYLPWLLVLLETFARSSAGFWLNDVPSLMECLTFPFKLGRGRLLGDLLLLVFVALFVYAMTKSGRVTVACKGHNPSTVTSWLAIGMLSWLGTALVGLALSWLVHPFLITRYLIPVAPIAWTMLSVMAMRYLERPYLTWGLIVALILMGVPSYCQRMADASERYGVHQQTMDALTSSIQSGDTILTDTYALDWTVLSVYMPGCPHEPYDPASPPVLSPDKSYWLMLESEKELDAARAGFESQGYDVVDTGIFGLIVKYPVHLYRIERL